MLHPGEFKFFTGSYTVPLDSCPPYIDTVTVIATNICTLAAVTATNTASCPGTNSPDVAVSKSCPAGLVQPGETLSITGTVTNTGNITLTNVMVTNVIAALSQSRRILGPTNLPPGGVAAFTDSYIVPLDSCGPYRDTVIASGADKCFGRVVTASDFKDCPGTNSPAIRVTKRCPTNPVAPGETLTISGTVTNTGNITLTNVTVTNVIAALSQSRRILGPTNLPPGGVAAFTDSYIVPLDSCGPYPDTVVAAGADKCFGRMVMATNSASCPGTNSPAIRVTKRCPTNPVAPGEISVFSGTVSNAGNITLTNVIVVNDQPTNNTLVLGPITLAPGESTNFTGSYRIPLNCCIYVDTLKATGADKCFGRVVTNTATAVCTTLTTPALRVTKECPPEPVPVGQPLVFFGTVSNAGNITLTNVVVVNNQPSNNTPVLGPMTLAPGQVVGFMDSYLVPLDICDTNIPDMLTASGNSICTGSNVTHSASSLCPIVTTPKLSLVKRCPPQPVPFGGLLVYSGTVSNSGNVAITNVVVVNDKPTNNTPVLGPITLRPGEFANFTNSYQTCTLCCPPYVDTVTATGNDACTGSNVTAKATASCPGVTSPAVSVTKECPPEPIHLGETLSFSGVVRNEGDVTLENVTVQDDHAGMVGYIAALAPGEAFGYIGSYVPTNCGPNVAGTVVVTALDICTGRAVSNNITAGCEVICPPSQPPTILNPNIAGDLFSFSFGTESNRNYTVQYTPSLSPIDWQTLTNFMGDGSPAIIQDTKTSTQRFYRVLMQ